jgi:hypothetical protein
MTSQESRKGPSYKQIVDGITVLLGTVVGLAMVYRDSWPLPAIMFALACLGRLSSRALTQYFLERVDEKE